MADSGSVNVDVTNVDLALTITETLSEISPGMFSANLDLDGTYSAVLGHLFRADYATGMGPIFTTFSKVLDPRSISFVPSSTSFDLGDFVGFTVNDQTANLDMSSIDSVTITVTSPTDPIGVNIVLDETNIDSGIFSGTSNIVFMNGALTPLITDTITVTQNDDTAPNPGLVQTVTRNISSTSDPVGVNIDLMETGINTNVYSATITFCSSAGCSNELLRQLEATSGDFITFQNLGGTIKSNGIIFPNTIDDRGALLVTCVLTSCDIITASYGSLSIDASIGDEFAPGGGGGGISRAGIVLNAVSGASLFGGGGGGDFAPPAIELGNLSYLKSFKMPDEIRSQVEIHDPKVILSAYDKEYDNFRFPLSINSKGFALAGFENTIETQIVETNEPVEIELTIYENSELQHVSLFTNLSGGLPQHSDTEIAYDKSGGVSIIDPHKLIEDASFSLTEDKDNDFIKIGVFEIIFAKPMAKSDVIVRSWDEGRRSMDLFIRDAIEVIPSESFQENPIIEEQVEPEPEVIEPEIVKFPAKSKSIPEWIKTTTLWWSNGEITDDTFVKSIQFLIQAEILELPPTDSASKTMASSAIPDWIRNTGSWWASGAISDNEFIMAIQYLVQNNIIIV